MDIFSLRKARKQRLCGFYVTLEGIYSIKAKPDIYAFDYLELSVFTQSYYLSFFPKIEKCT